MTPKKAEQIVAEAQRQVEECVLGQCQHHADPFPEIQGYEIVSEIHRGGQGVVFEAEQETPSRCVAIKLLRHGLASSHEDRFRFEREMQILGRLSHPNIVTIYDAGVAAGCQYFVMEFIPGETLDAHIRDAGLSVEQTVRFFLMICDAIDAAHKGGVFHRDLKPSNIRVDDKGIPHILDFGLATDATAAEASITYTGQFIGSLPWASPEQAAGEPNSIDARTDVYALGLILYHILTEKFPYAVAGPLPLVLDTIQKAEPSRPSAFRHDIPLDLEHIVLKCLRKEKELRYQWVSELSADLRRFLAHEPVEARGDSTWYRLANTVRRHRRAAAVAFVLLILNLVYSMALTIYYRRSVAAETRARQAADEADEAVRAFNDAYEGFIGRLGKFALAPGTAALQRELTLEAYERLRAFAEQRPDDRRASTSFAIVLHRMGELAVKVNRREEGLGYFREAAQIREGLVREHPEKLELQADLSVNIVRIGDTLKELGDLESGRELYKRALAIDEALVEAAPDNAHFWDNLSWSYQRLGLLATARGENELAASYYNKELEAALRCVELEPDNPVRRGTLIEAQLRTAAEFETADQLPSMTSAKLRLEAAKLRLTCTPAIPGAQAELDRAEKRVERTRANAYARAKSIELQVAEFRRDLGREPGNPILIRNLLNALGSYEYGARDGGLHEKAKEASDAAISLATKLVEADPDEVDNVRLLVGLYAWAGTRAHQAGDLETALIHNRAELDTAKAALRLVPNDPQLLFDACAAQQEEGLLLLKLGRRAEAEVSINAAMVAVEQTREQGLLSPEFERYYGRILTEPQSLGYRDIDRGLDLMNRGVETSCANDPLCWEELGNTAAAAGRMDVACPAYKRALEVDLRLAP